MLILQNQHESTFSVKVWNVAVMELKQVFDFGYITRIGLSFIAFCSEFASYKYIPRYVTSKYKIRLDKNVKL